MVSNAEKLRKSECFVLAIQTGRSLKPNIRKEGVDEMGGYQKNH